jgi:dephospho-CoA kinase
MIIIGLTGSLAMGKTTIAAMFKNQGCPIFDADKEVHKLYQTGGKAAATISTHYPDVMIGGSVDRQLLAAKISKDATVLPKIEKIVHPLVHSLEKQFVLNHQQAGMKIIVLDIPLLFEADRTDDVDFIVVVSASPERQKKRALARPGMTEKKLDLILSRQLPDKEKRARADYIIDTSVSLKETLEQVKTLITKLELLKK